MFGLKTLPRVGHCVGALLSSVNKFPYIFKYGLQGVSGYKICNSSCEGIENGFPGLNKVMFPGASDILLFPRSTIVLTREHGGNTTTNLQFFPTVTREHLYLTVPNVTVLIPVLPTACSEVIMDVDHPVGYSLLSQTNILFSAQLTNKGKVSIQLFIFKDQWWV